MPNLVNGVYDTKPWVAPPLAAYPPQAYIGPFPSNQDRMTSQAIGVMDMTAADIQEYVRPNIPQIDPFPPKYGYFKGAPGIEDIIQLTSRTYERTNFSGEDFEINSTNRNNLGATI
jgi:hypothetical protein